MLLLCDARRSRGGCRKSRLARDVCVDGSGELSERPSMPQNHIGAENAFSDSGSVKAGLRRLAYGSCKDAVTLAFSEELPPPL